jgi:arylsulfatase A-like enzyme
MHILLPHSPYVWDEQCNYTLKLENGYAKQTLCATKLMAEIVAALKSLHRYHDSLIVFQSDHGHEKEARISELSSQMPDRIKSTIRSALKLESDEFNDYVKRLHALLLVKPPFDSNESMHTSSTVTQLADIPATIAQLVSIEALAAGGRSLFTLEQHKPREIHIFFGQRKRDFMHLSYSNDGKGTIDWKVLGNVSTK